MGGPDDGDRRKGSQESDLGHRGHGAVEPADGELHLSRNLRAGCRDRAPALALPLTWIEQRLSESGLTIEQLVQSETQQQAVDQVSISNSIGSLRFLGGDGLADFVEAKSVVEQTLREDPAAVYGKMDFATRDRYRHEVEKMAKRSRLSEGEVARQAIHLAQAGGRKWR